MRLRGMELSPISLLLMGFGVFGSGLAFGITLWQIISGQRAIHNYLFALATLAGTWWVTLGGMVVAGLVARFPGLFTSDIALIYLIGPCIYGAFHLRSGLWQPELRHLWHAAPAVVAFLLVTPALFGTADFKRLALEVTYSIKLPDAYQLAFRETSEANLYAHFLVLIKILGKTSLMGYVSLLIRKASHLVRRPGGLRSVLILRGYFALMILATFVSLMSHFAGAAGAALAVLAGTTAVLGVQVVDGFFSVFHRDPEGTKRSRPASRGRVSGLDTAGVLSRLTALMEEEGLYCDEDLSLSRLAELLGIRIDQLSFLLNQRLNQNFYSYVNGYRVGRAKELLAGDASLAFISQAVGFNSQQVFTSVFRKHAGMTPGQFREALKVQGLGVHNS